MSLKDMSPEIQERIHFARKHSREKFGIEFTEIEEGRATGTLKIEEKHLNAFGIPYGTFVFNLADMMAGIAFLTVGCFGPTLSGNINFISGAKIGDTLICHAKIMKHGRKISFLNAEIRTEKDLLIATADFTYYHL